MNLRTALRSVARTPLVTLLVVLSLGLGIGSNTALFSLLDQIVLRPLPVPEPESLSLLTFPAEFKSGRISTNNAGGSEYVFSYPAFRRIEGHREEIAELAGYRLIGANIAYESATVSGSLMLVSGGFFPAMRVRPRIGRLLSHEDDVHGVGNPVVVLAYGYWRDRMGADPSVLNKPMRVNGEPFTIVGVLPREYQGPTIGDQPDLYVPLALKPRMTPGWDSTDNYRDYWLYAISRTAPGFSREQAQAALNSAYASIVEEQAEASSSREGDYLERYRQARLTLLDGSKGHAGIRDDAATTLMILMAATTLVLLIALANAVNLLLARATQRRKELAVHVALGAGRRHLIMQMLTEAMIISVAAGLFGLLLGGWTISLIVAMIAEGESVYFISSSLNWTVLLFALFLSVTTGLLLGLYPALVASGTSIVDTLKEGSQKSSAGRGGSRVRKGLVATQVAISAMLLIPTGLFLKSLVNLTHLDLGLDTSNLITFGVSPDLNGYDQPRIRALFESMESELAAIPGVTGVTSSMVPLIGGSNWGTNLTVEGFEGGPDVDTNSRYSMVGPEFFSTMGTPLVAGRELSIEDGQAGAKVAVVNETFARHFFGEANPIGRMFTTGSGDVTLDTEIVGLIQDAKYSDVKDEIPNLFYEPWRQDEHLNTLFFYVRSPLPAAQAIASVRQVMRRIDRDLPLEDLRSMEEQVAHNIRNDRMVLKLSAAFAILATVLAMLGLYGVMAYSVAQRVREIGIRMALGAASGAIRSMVMKEMMRILVIGLTIGVPVALALGKVTESELFVVTAFDLPVVLGVAAALSVAAALAGWIPARRATLVDPVESLRYE